MGATTGSKRAPKAKPRTSAAKKPLARSNRSEPPSATAASRARSAQASRSSLPSDEVLSLAAFALMARTEVRLPVNAHVIGEPVTLIDIQDPGLPHVGLLARCQRGERTYDVSLAEVVFTPGSAAAALATRYRKWLGLPTSNNGVPEPVRPHKIASDDITIGEPVELIVVACKSNALRCRVLGSTREITLRTTVRDHIPGTIVTITPTRHWTHARHPYLAGDITATRLDVEALGLTPLALHEQGDWDPDQAYWGEEDEPIADWAKPIIAHGKRPMFELEQILPGADSDDFDSDPIVEAAELRASGDLRGAYKVLMNTLAQDLRCIDAHAHLGNFEFDRHPERALQHYEMGTAIGALTLGKAFDGVLPWGLIDNRPFLRCLHGAGLCAWRLGDVRTAKAVFTKMLWLNPSDNQGARFNLAAIEAGKTWQEMEGAL